MKAAPTLWHAGRQRRESSTITDLVLGRRLIASFLPMFSALCSPRLNAALHSCFSHPTARSVKESRGASLGFGRRIPLFQSKPVCRLPRSTAGSLKVPPVAHRILAAAGSRANIVATRQKESVRIGNRQPPGDNRQTSALPLPLRRLAACREFSLRQCDGAATPGSRRYRCRHPQRDGGFRRRA